MPFLDLTIPQIHNVGDDDLNILKISKYPPIEGGESSNAYWYCKGLGKRGHKIFVLTNSYEVEDPYREQLTVEDLDKLKPKNVNLYSTNPFEMPGFIPSFNPITIKLISKGIEILENEDIDVIEGSYLLPYGFVAHYLSKQFDKPLVLTHAGSDMTRILNSPHYISALKRTILSANAIVTFPRGASLFTKLGVNKNKVFEIKKAVDENEFSPKVKKDNLKKLIGKNPTGTILTHFGKIDSKKGLFELTNALSKIKNDYSLILIGTGIDESELKQHLTKLGISERVFFHNFVTPWRVPAIMKSSDCLLSVEHDFGVNIHGPILPREALSTGKPVLVSNEINLYHELTEFKDGIISINPSEPKQYEEKLDYIISNKKELKKIGLNGRKWIEKNNNFNKYLKKRVEVYETLMRR
ncbi:MAG: glycosyltransferase family 4 protein [archaeon]|jgi:glycosyltransferase involved in cell wall biosynthesis